MTELTGKAAFVTGGSRGIGAAIVRRLAASGADVAFTFHRSERQAEEVRTSVVDAGRRGLAHRVDSADAEALVGAVRRASEAFGQIDILVNSAGIAPYGPFETYDLEEIDRAFHIHARAAFVATQEAVRHMRSGGRVVSIGSTLAEHSPQAGFSLYSMSKAALIGLTKGLARELGPRGITVNLVHPGSTDTEMNPADGPTAESERALIALGRYNEADDVARMVAFLAGEGGRNVTGAAFTIDGGATA
jgi:NAD(P)-dependent dehydrogenase (short-subunit alcohol dehydrogenase family)